MLLGLSCRRQKCSGVSTLIVLAACTACAAVLLLLLRLRECTEELRRHTQHCRQQEESLSAQLQVLYEHRSRLERSLQKERAEHKKTKEDFLQYKLEAQETLNKEKQDSANKYSGLSSKHSILKNELTDLHSQLQLLQKEHGQQHFVQLKSLEECQQQAALLRTENLVVKLQEESKLLRHSHLEMHHQLLRAQAQVKESQQVGKLLPRKTGSPDLLWQEQAQSIAGSRQLDHKVSMGPLQQEVLRSPTLSNSTGLGRQSQANALYFHPPEEKLSQTEAVGKELIKIHPISQRGLSVRDLEKNSGIEKHMLELDRKSLMKQRSYNHNKEQKSPTISQRINSQHRGNTGTGEVESIRQEIPDNEKDFGERQGDEEVEMDTFGQEQPQSLQIIVQEPMDDWRIREPEDEPEEEEGGEKAAGSEDEY